MYMDSYNFIVVKKEKKGSNVHVQFIEKLKFIRAVVTDTNKLQIVSTKTAESLQLLTKNQKLCEELHAKLEMKHKTVIFKELNEFEKNLTELEKICFKVQSHGKRKRAKTDLPKLSLASIVKQSKNKKKKKVSKKEFQGNKMFMSLVHPPKKKAFQFKTKENKVSNKAVSQKKKKRRNSASKAKKKKEKSVGIKDAIFGGISKWFKK